jgi:2-polyprenyl-3-methyl-5-hydroxy-6-metoxy-1,4-benzoquinol methylase
MECLLCNSNQLTQVESIDVADLIQIYSTITKGYNIENEFRGTKKIYLNRCNTCDFQFYSPQISGSDKFYEYLQKYEWYYRSDKPEFKVAYNYIKKDENVLEVGAGSGFFAKNLICKSYKGLEFNDASILEAKVKGINLIREDVEHHSLNPENVYDIVCAFQVLEHVPNPKVFISSCVKMLRKNGKLIFAIPSADSYAAKFPNHSLNLPPHHISLWTDKNLKNIGELFGLKTVTIFHETCDKDQYKMFLYALLLEKYNRFFNVKFSLVQTGLFNKIKNKIFLKIASYLVPKNLEVFASRGQSVVVIYEKE